MNAGILVSLGVLALAAPLAGQQRSTAEQLRQARGLYDRLELERSVRLLRAVVAPDWAAPATDAQLVQAYQYLGASFMLLGRADSSVAYFRAALARDPFLDLAADEFTPAQLGAFARARRQVFAVATRPLGAGRVDPRTERIRLAFATTHDATVQAELRRGDSVVNTFELSAQGPGEIAWDGLTAGRLVPPGRYEFRVRATSRIMDQRDSASTYFDLRHEIEALEDTLAMLTASELLPERRSASAAWGDLGKGAAVAGGVWLIAGALSSASLGRDDSGKPALVAGTALVAGAFAFLRQRKARELPANIAANRQRREQRRAQADSIRARNAQRIAATMLVVAPAAGVGP